MDQLTIFLPCHEVQDLRVQFTAKASSDDQIMGAVDAKVEEWKVCGTITLTAQSQNPAESMHVMMVYSICLRQSRTML